MNKCTLCGAKTEQKLVFFDLREKDKLYSLANVPAWVCTVCAEKTFAPETVDIILKVIKEQKLKPETSVQVPVWDLKNTPFFKEFTKEFYA